MIAASHGGGGSCHEAWFLGVWASVAVARGLSSCGSRALERRLDGCEAQTQLLHSLWDLPGSGIKPVSPVLAGGWLPLSHQGSPPALFFNNVYLGILLDLQKVHKGSK